ncbi:CDC45 family [Glomus cerebriforme]|uniref:CDC45 family n=1 Tax=Glomus cerebriforme TaxID=658196 RepID=A0A397SW64_9GLOM|nr:CDC45 family [Glomus cerebriforme]
MFCNLEQFKHIFETLLFQAEDDVVLFDCSVRLYCYADIDSMCAAEILKKLFFREHVIWTLKPIRTYDDFDRNDLKPSQNTKSLRAIILLNFGSNLELAREFDLTENPHVNIYVIDSLHPVNLTNLYDRNSHIFIVYDEDSKEYPEYITKALKKESEEEFQINTVFTDDFGRPITLDESDNIEVEPKRRYGTSIALMTYFLASKLLLKDNDMLWLAIIGHTSLYITKRLALLDYKNNVDTLDAEVKELNDLYMSNRLHRHKAVASEADDKRIIPIYEYNCVLMGHWTVYESILNSEYTITKMKLKENQGENLDKLLRNMGISHKMSKEYFPAMDVEVANRLAEMINSEGPKYKFDIPLYDGWAKFYGYKLPTFSASDAVYGLITLLKTKPSASVEFGVEIQWVNDFNGKFEWLNNFHTALDALDSKNGWIPLKAAIELRKKLQPLIINGGARDYCLFS